MSVTLLKRDSSTGVFLWILRNFYRTPSVASSDIVLIWISDFTFKTFLKETKKLENLNTTKSKHAFLSHLKFHCAIIYQKSELLKDL